MNRVVLPLAVLSVLSVLATPAHAHKRVFRKAVAVAVPTTVTVQEQRTTITNTRNNNDAVTLNVNRAQELVEQTNVFIQNPLFATAAGVPVSQFAYCQPASAVQYGAYMMPQQSYVNPQALPQGGYQATQKTYSQYAADYREFIELYRAWKSVREWDGKGQPPAAAAAPEPKTAIQQSCVKCHSGPTPKGQLDLSDMSLVSCEQRLAAIARVTSDDPAKQMPPAGQPRPDPSAIGALVQELSDFAAIRTLAQPQSEPETVQPPAANDPESAKEQP